MLLKSVGGSSLQHPSTEKLARKSRRRRRRWWHAIIYFGWLVPKCHPMASYCSLVSYTPIELSIWKKSFLCLTVLKMSKINRSATPNWSIPPQPLKTRTIFFFIKKLKKIFFAKMKMLQRTNFLQASDMTIETKPVSFDLIVKNVSFTFLF